MNKEEEKKVQIGRVESSSKNMSEFWQAIREFRPRKRRKREDISKENCEWERIGLRKYV